jgi:RHS repeat-associated protein
MPIDIASGIVHDTFQDVNLPGLIPLIWDRHYSSAPSNQLSGALGKGWTHGYSATLTRYAGGFEFTRPSGTVERLADPARLVESGETIRHLAGFFEIFLESDNYVIQTWSAEGLKTIRYYFSIGSLGETRQLSAIGDPRGRFIELYWDDEHRLRLLHQRPSGRQIALTYNNKNKIEQIALKEPDSRLIPLVRYSYNAEDLLSAAIDPKGFADRYEYDEQGRISRQIIRDGGVFHFRYENQGRCICRIGLNHYDEKRLRFLDATRITEVIDSLGSIRRYAYLPTGQITTEWDPLGGVQKTEYDIFGRIIAKTDYSSAITKYTYDEYGNRDTVTNALGIKISIVYNKQHQAISKIDASGRQWQRTYDNLNRLESSQDPDGHQWTFKHDVDGNLVELSSPNGSKKIQSYSNGLLHKVSDWIGQFTTLTYDSLGNLIEHCGPGGVVTKYAYDALGHLLQINRPDGTTLRAGYDPAGNMTHYIDARGEITRWRYGPCGRLLERIDPMRNSIRFIWSTEPGRIDGFINENDQIYSFERDDLGRIVKETSFDGSQRSFRYNSSGETIGWTNAEGETVEIERNLLQQVLAMNLPDGDRLHFLFDPDGRLQSATNSNTQVEFCRDAHGRITMERQGKEWIKSTYDPMGALIHTQTSQDIDVNYQVDANGALTLLTCQSINSIEFLRDEYGQSTCIKLPGDLAVRQLFDSMGRVVEKYIGSFKSSVVTNHHFSNKISYNYDSGGNLAQISDDNWSQTEYICDSIGHLVGAFESNGASEEFLYDRSGNLTHLERSGQHSRKQTLRYGRGNRLLQQGETLFEYDKLGRRLKKIENDGKIWHYVWNALNQLTRLETPDGTTWLYSYDALGRRVSKVEKLSGKFTEIKYIWDQDVIIHTVRNNMALESWIFDPDGFTLLASIQNGQFYSIISDQLGTPLEFIDSDGSSAWSGRQSVWGDVIISSSSNPHIKNPLSFPGHWRDDESGLHYNYFRYYDPEAGSYISPDPIQLEGGFNFYRYTNNPTNWIDPYGLTCPHDTNGGEGYTVYHIKDGEGNVLYVGITAADRFDTRQSEHIESGRLSGDRVMESIVHINTYGEARGHEQAHIEHYGTRDTSLIGNHDYANNPGNRINSFDTSRTDNRANVYNQAYSTAQGGFT